MRKMRTHTANTSRPSLEFLLKTAPEFRISSTAGYATALGLLFSIGMSSLSDAAPIDGANGAA
ncbi:hypothetical protein, partial [Escherichia coli]|uniref:hypothetical protein n=1 Tax=Escherichia coli TaxID=562 RepID=UPI0019537207